MPQYGVRLLHVGDGDIPGPELFWMSDWDGWFPLAFQCVLIQGEGVTALVSTGAPEDIGPLNERWSSVLGERAKLRRTQDQWVLNQLAAAGVAPEDVTHVVLSPLQLYTTANVPRFRNARICLSKQGWVHYQTSHAHPHDDRWTSIDQEVLAYMTIEAWDKVRLLEDEDEIAPGLRTWWTGSHHRASLCVEVDTPAGVVTITDAYFVERNLRDDHPIGICENLYEALAAHERVRRVADHALTLYDPGQLQRYPDGIVARAPA